MSRSCLLAYERVINERRGDECCTAGAGRRMRRRCCFGRSNDHDLGGVQEVQTPFVVLTVVREDVAGEECVIYVFGVSNLQSDACLSQWGATRIPQSASNSLYGPHNSLGVLTVADEPDRLPSTPVQCKWGETLRNSREMCR